MKIKGIYTYSLVMVSGNVTYGLFVWAPRFCALVGEYSVFIEETSSLFLTCVYYRPDFITLNVAVLRGDVSVLLYHCFHYVSLMQVYVKSH
jgi:hypothetical protein